MPGIGGAGFAIPRSLSDHHDEAYQQPGNGGGNHHQTNKANRAKHDVAHCDLAGDGGLSNRLDDDGARLGTG
jgi:hypothetical protein